MQTILHNEFSIALTIIAPFFTDNFIIIQFDKQILDLTIIYKT